MSERGLLIVGEGADFSGKTTQISLLKEAWKDRDDVLYVREPGGTPFGEDMRQLLFHPPETISPLTQLHLLTAGRVHACETVIGPALDAGMTVLTDRNYYSSFGYQGAGGGLPLELIEEITRTSLPDWYMHPDKAFVMTVPAAERLRRKASRDFQDGKQDAFEKQDEDYFERVNDTYTEHIVGHLGAVAIDGTGSRLDIHQDILDYLASSR